MDVCVGPTKIPFNLAGDLDQEIVITREYKNWGKTPLLSLPNAAT